MHLITTTNGQPMTTSLVIAEKFGKRHDTVLRAIRNLECSGEFTQRNFAECYRINELANGKREPYFEITRDGFAFLCMGFTGKEAAAWKVKFLEAFNAMERALRQHDSHRHTQEWLEARASGKVARLKFTDGVAEFVDYAIRQGSRNADKYYLALTKMEYRALFLLEHQPAMGLRDKLDAAQLTHLATAEAIAQRALREGMEAGMHYKSIFQQAKQRVEALARLVGKTLPGERSPQLRYAA